MPTQLDRLNAVRELRPRIAKARQFLAETEAARAVEAIHEELVRLRRTGAGRAMAAVDAVAVAITEPGELPYATVSALYEAAASRGMPAVARLFFTTSNAAASAPAPQADLAAERPAHPRGKPLALGSRTWLARRVGPRADTALSTDPHPSVVASVLANPATTEADVLAIASRRPTQPSCQIAIFSSDRWRARHPVRRALALNPHTPVALAARVAIALRDGDLREIAKDAKLSETLREHADDVLSLGGARGAPS